MKTTEENNRLIAEFMGYELQSDPTERFFGRFKTPITKVWVKEIELAFNSSWDWLMPVVEKIENLGYHTSLMKLDTLGLHQLLIKNNTGKDYDFDYASRDTQLLTIGKTKLEATYKTVTAFIEWWNENGAKEKWN